VFNTIFDLTLLNILVLGFGMPIVFANLISATLSMSLSYFLNHHLVFRSSEKHSIKKFINFLLVTGVGILGIQTLIILLVTHFLYHFTTQIESFLASLHIELSTQAFILNLAKIVAVFASMIWNFTIYYYFIFKSDREDLDVQKLE
jgi:putative flippase GtrA